MAETEAIEKEFTKCFNADLIRLGETARMTALTLKPSRNTWPSAREAEQLPEPVIKGTVTWFDFGGAEHK